MAKTKTNGTKPDMSGFKRGNLLGISQNSALYPMAQSVSGDLGDAFTPHAIPWHVIRMMGLDPVINLGEMALTTPVKNPALYYVHHADAAIRAETEQWLAPILPALTASIARSCSWGAAAYVLDWEYKDLRVLVQREGARPRRKTIPGHYHFAKVRPLYPGGVSLEVDDAGDVTGIHYAGTTYGADRSFLSVWDSQFVGEYIGNGSRARCYPDWYKGTYVDLFQNSYLERSVDSPRIGRAPSGNVKMDGVEIPATDVLNSALMGLKNGGACVLPSTSEDGRALWDVTPMDLPDRSNIWQTTLARYDARKLLACLVPPSTVGLEDASFAGARIPSQMFVEFVQGVASFVATELSNIVETVHIVNHGDASPPPTVRAYEIPAAKKKILLEVWRSISGLTRVLDDGRKITLADLVSDEIIDQLGIPRRQVPALALSPADVPSAPASPARDTTSEREERRDAAREPEGEDATGAPGEQVGAA